MPKILDRLARQLRSRGVNNAMGMAKGLLNRYGLMKSGSMMLTSKGKRRNSMSPSKRAKDRASKRSGQPASKYRYNKATNRATLR